MIYVEYQRTSDRGSFFIWVWWYQCACSVVNSSHAVRQYPNVVAPYQSVYLPWRRLPNPLLSYQTGTGFGARLNGELAELFTDHRFGDQVLVPAASHLTMLAGLHLRNTRRNGVGVAVRQVVFTQPASWMVREQRSVVYRRQG